MSERRPNIISFTRNFSLRLAAAKNFSALSDKSERELYSFVTQTFDVLPEDTELDEIEKLVRTKAIGTSVYSLTVMPSDGWCQTALWIANLWFLVNDIYPSMIYREIHDVHSKFAEICAEATQSSNETDPEIISDACKIISDALSKDPPLTRKQIQEEAIRIATRSRKEEIHERVEKAALAAKQQRFSNGTVAVENSQKSEDTKVTEETEEKEEDEDVTRNSLAEGMEAFLPKEKHYLFGDDVNYLLNQARGISSKIENYNIPQENKRRVFIESIAFVFSQEMYNCSTKMKIINVGGVAIFGTDAQRKIFFSSFSGMRQAIWLMLANGTVSREEYDLLIRRLNEYAFVLLHETNYDYLGLTFVFMNSSMEELVADCRNHNLGAIHLLYLDYVYNALIGNNDLTLDDLGTIRLHSIFDEVMIVRPFAILGQAAFQTAHSMEKTGSRTYCKTSTTFDNRFNFSKFSDKPQKLSDGCILWLLIGVAVAIIAIIAIIASL